MTAFEYLVSLPQLPTSTEGGRISQRPSKGTLKRWLNQKAVIINGVTPTAREEITFPVGQLVFFPKSKRGRVTMMLTEKYWQIEKSKGV